MTGLTTYIILGFVACAIGALPFGLVNLVVLGTSFRHGKKEAMKIASGASLVEVVFGLAAILAGSFISKTIGEKPFLEYFVAGVLALAGLVFLLKNTQNKTARENIMPGFLKGVFLNLVSLQVLLFWILAVAYLFSKQWLDYQTSHIILFVAGIWAGKMATLWVYAYLSKSIVPKSKTISKHINQIIGGLLIVIAGLQAAKILIT